MTPATLVLELTRRGVRLAPEGGRLRYEAPPGALTVDLLAALREHKAAILELLAWPAECWQSEALYGQPHARLFPLIGRPVWTPQGAGRLVQVFSNRAAVVLDCQPGLVAFLDPGAIRPGQAQGLPGQELVA